MTYEAPKFSSSWADFCLATAFYLPNLTEQEVPGGRTGAGRVVAWGWQGGGKVAHLDSTILWVLTVNKYRLFGELNLLVLPQWR